MNVLEVVHVETYKHTHKDFYCIDSPVVGQGYNNFVITLSGWVVSENPAQYIEILESSILLPDKKKLLARIPLDVCRKDVLHLYQQSEGLNSALYGFSKALDVYPSSVESTIYLVAQLDNDEELPIGEVVIKSDDYFARPDLHGEAQIYHIHIPKTAGTFLKQQLQKNVLPSEILFVYEALLTSAYDSYVAQAIGKCLQNCRIIFGHFSYGFHRRGAISREYSYTTILRDPREWFISYLNHLIQQLSEIEKSEIRQFALEQLLNINCMFPLCNNPQTRILSAVHGALDVPYWVDAIYLYKIALRNLETEFSAVGTVNNMDSFVLDFSNVVGVQIFNDQKLVNAAERNSWVIEELEFVMNDSFINELFHKAFSYDIDLYNKVVERNCRMRPNLKGQMI